MQNWGLLKKLTKTKGVRGYKPKPGNFRVAMLEGLESAYIWHQAFYRGQCLVVGSVRGR